MLKMHAISIKVENVDTGDILSYHLNPNACIEDVRYDLVKKDILSDGMGIFYEDRELEDDCPVKDLNINDGSRLELRQKE